MKSTKVPKLISTYPTKKSATDTAEQAVKLKLAACVNTVRISSVKGKIESGSEYMSKRPCTYTSHPYKVPEIASISMTSINHML